VFVEGVNYAGDLSTASSLPISLNVAHRVVYEVHDYGFWYSGLTGYSDWYGRINPKWGYLVTGNNPSRAMGITGSSTPTKAWESRSQGSRRATERCWTNGD
jgi:hypothetical protein